MNRKNSGFTLVEIVVVLLLISIIAAAVFARSVSTDQINFVAQVDKIRNHIRYPQSMAMKRNELWGFKSASGEYWIFSGSNADDGANQKPIPGEESVKVSLGDLNVAMDSFTVFFDGYGRPYYPDSNTLLSGELSIDVNASGGDSRTFKILEETGLVR